MLFCIKKIHMVCVIPPCCTFKKQIGISMYYKMRVLYLSYVDTDTCSKLVCKRLSEYVSQKTVLVTGKAKLANPYAFINSQSGCVKILSVGALYIEKNLSFFQTMNCPRNRALHILPNGTNRHCCY